MEIIRNKAYLIKHEQAIHGLNPKCINIWNNTFNNDLRVWTDVFSLQFMLAATHYCSPISYAYIEY